ncbi:MAG TPA: DUF6306 domain-containing protein [Burkholderiales bacterium]|nr:hypothetical protein [Pseudomonadota bacterium]HVC49193.1 DUF6306 domain-containing protein [Burkholderiales bacterium]
MESVEVIGFLNTLLEAERAGAKVVAQFMESYPQGSEVMIKLRDVQRDEARNCSILLHLVRQAGGEPSHATGDFLHKALAISDPAERLIFLNRGQSWVARKIPEWIPKIADIEIRNTLKDMETSHISNIKICNDLISLSK